MERNICNCRQKTKGQTIFSDAVEMLFGMSKAEHDSTWDTSLWQHKLQGEVGGENTEQAEEYYVDEFFLRNILSLTNF